MQEADLNDCTTKEAWRQVKVSTRDMRQKKTKKKKGIYSLLKRERKREIIVVE
jgi:hypothetical protein